MKSQLQVLCQLFHQSWYILNTVNNCIPQIATRKTYGDALVKLGKNFPRIYALDGDTKNSTFSLTYKKAFDDRYIECFIAEQNLVGVGIGLACRDRTVVFISTFAAFFTRTFDQIRMGAISQTQVNCVGSHAGCSIGEFTLLWVLSAHVRVYVPCTDHCSKCQVRMVLHRWLLKTLPCFAPSLVLHAFTHVMLFRLRGQLN